MPFQTRFDPTAALRRARPFGRPLGPLAGGVLALLITLAALLIGAFVLVAVLLVGLGIGSVLLLRRLFSRATPGPLGGAARGTPHRPARPARAHPARPAGGDIVDIEARVIPEAASREV